MESTSPFSIEHKLTADLQRSSDINTRLELLLATNAEIARSKAAYPTRQIEIARSLMTNPIDATKTFAYLGLMFGSLPPAAFFLMAFSSANRPEPWITALLTWVVIVTAATGYFSGKVVAKILGNYDDRSLSFCLLVVPLVGFAWGASSGATGGVFIFLIGAIFGAMIGGAVGAVALTVFFLIYRMLTVAGMIELKHFLPIAAGITFTIWAFILSFI